MNEEQIQELKNLVDKLQEQGLSTEEIQARVDLKKQEFQKPDFQTPTTPGAVVEETAAPDMESKSEDGSLVSQDEFDAAAELDTAGDLFKANLKRAAANLAEFPAFVNRLKFALGKALPEKFGGLTEEQRKKLDELTPEQQDAYAQALGGIATPGAPDIGGLSRKGQEVGAKLRAEAEELEKNLIQYDSDITDTIFKEGNITEGTTRLLTQVIGTLPSVMQAFIPGVGIPSIVAGSAAEASREAVYEKGKDITLGQQAYATGIGASEGLLEIVTKRIGGAAFKNLIGKPKEIVKKTLLQTGTGIVKAGGQEGLSETGTLAINKFLESKYYNEKGLFEMDKQKWDEFWSEAGDTFLIGMATGKSIAGAGAGASIVRNTVGDRSVRKTLEKTNVKEVSEAFKNENITEDAINLSRNVFSERKLNEELNTKLNNGEITFNESNEIKLNFNNAQAAIKLADNIKIVPSLINETVNLIQERNKLSNTVKQAGENKALVSEEASRLKEIDIRLAEISKQNISIKLDERIEKLEKPIKPPGSLMVDPLGIITAADKLRQVKLEEAKQTKISNEVQDIYNEKGEAGALDIIEKFRPITDKLVRKRRDAPNYDEQLLRDEIETGERGIFDLIRSYNPESGIPLSGYINKFLPARAIEASKRVLGEQFTQDVTEIKESKIEIDDTTQKTLDFVRTEPEAKEQLRDVAGITKESVQADAQQILKGKLPGILEKSGRDKNEILTAINKASQLKIADAVLEEMGGNFSNKEEQNSRFITFMDVNFEATMKAIPNSVKNKLPLFEAQQVGRESMVEGDEAGKGVFEYKNPTRDEFIKYYTEGGLTTLRAKKKKLADILAQEIGKDAIAEVLSDPQVQKDFLERQELQGKKIPEGAIPKLLERIDRTIAFLEKPIAQPGTLQSSFGVNIADEVRRIALKILKIIRKALSEGVTFNKAKQKALNEIRKENSLPKEVQKTFDETFSAGIASESDVTPKNVLKTTGRAEEAKTKASINYGILTDTKRLKNIINDKNSTDEVKVQKLKLFFKGHAQVYQKTSKRNTGIYWKGQTAEKAFNYWEKKLGSKLKKLGFSISGAYIKYKGETIFNPKGRPSLINQNKLRKKYYIKKETINSFTGKEQTITEFNNKKAPEYYKASGKYYKDQIEELDKQSNDYIDNIIETARSILETEGKEAMSNYIYLMNDYSDSPLRLVGKIKSYEISNKSRGPHVYDHTPPINDLIRGINSIIASTDDVQEILDKTRKILQESEVNLITKETDNKLNELGRRSTGNKKTRLIGAVDPKNLIEIKRPKQEIKEETDKVDLNKGFNDILEQKTGIASEERYTKAKAEIRGKRKGTFDYIGIPPTAQDFMGLLYKTLGKGKLGDQQLAWYKKNLLDPFAKAMIDVSNYRVTLANNYKGIKKEGGITSEILQKKLPDGLFTVEQAIRVYIWNKQGIEIEGLEKNSSDLKQLVQYVKKNTKLATFANRLISINKKNKYPEPDENWLVGTITTDLLKSINTNVRKDALAQWKSNVDIIFSKDNMNKLEAAFGKKYRFALDNMLKRMESGRNRGYPGDQLTGRLLDWINGSVGTIMFFNMRSAVLQTISSINFINFTDNNPFKAAAAFANQPQFLKDVMFLMNSDFLVERRNGLKINVNEADIAEIAAESDNKAKAFINKILKLGFLPTQIADSFAIATGGATFYRNRIKSYIKKGLSEKEAEEKAFIDFREITEENQQSSRPDRISQQQAGPLGRIILAFANTPAQYARIMQKAASDLKNGRGDAKTNISKIIYYGAIQNIIFNAMQKSLFAIAFGDEEPDDEKQAEKYGDIVNGMADSLLRGVGLYGAGVSVVKNAIIKIIKGGDKEDVGVELLDFSPPISSKLTKMTSAGRTFDWNKKEIKEKGLSLDNPAVMAIGEIFSATTNVPLDRGVRKLINIKDALDTENEEWMRIANALGWAKWELEWEQDKRKKKKQTKTKIRKTF